MATIADFTKGQRVRYIGNHPKHAAHGLTARVVRPVKSRNVVTIDFEENQGWCGWYDAKPENIEPIDGKAAG